MRETVITKVRKHVCIQREYERGWGQKDIVATDYDTKELAEEAVQKCNARNTAGSAPDYYVQARYEAEVSEEEYDRINRS